MNFLDWNESFNTGIKSVDNEHSRAAEIINELHDLKDSNERSHILELLKEFYQLNADHFANEENLMKQYKTFNYFSHKAQHDRLLRILREFLRDFEANKIGLSDQMLNLFHDWMINHFKFHDKKMGIELVEKGAK
jgi:hemerythrin-like metal-binding protein